MKIVLAPFSEMCNVSHKKTTNWNVNRMKILPLSPPEPEKREKIPDITHGQSFKGNYWGKYLQN